MSDWQPIETAPKDGTMLLAYNWVGISVARWDVFSRDMGMWRKDGPVPTIIYPTHWIPIPAPPKTEVSREFRGVAREDDSRPG